MDALNRIRKSNERIAKSCLKINRKLKKKAKSNYDVATRRTYSKIEFAPFLRIIAQNARLAFFSSIKNQNGKRVFFTCEVEDSHQTSVPVLMSARNEDDVQVLCHLDSRCVFSEARVELFRCGDTKYVVRKLHLHNGGFVFFVSTDEQSKTCPPFSLGLDERLFERLVRNSAKMAAVNLTE